MSEDRSRYRSLIAYLEQLADRNDRAALAALRGSLREGHSLEALRYVLPLLGKDAGGRAEDDACLVAGLFALHPERGSLTLASALRYVREGGSDSTEARFIALLAARREDLPTHLRHAVGLVAGKKLALEWNDLYTGIRWWDHEDDFVRRRWAADFWAGRQPAETPPYEATSPASSATKGTEP
jgi:CRISPR system Cascade subunit CasB